ncbi:hypothetical protein WJX74_002393 [Apatococcus lobatus]|uniref:Uncharacterized protein n=1 Tax=Apatococcus lobatus TaxID=904363 RepID=A0AAW1RCN9_9CHLO
MLSSKLEGRGPVLQLLDRALAQVCKAPAHHFKVTKPAHTAPSTSLLSSSQGFRARSLDLQQARACSFFATCHPGLEQAVAKELSETVPGTTVIQPGRAGVSFRGADISVGYNANLWLRSAIRVLLLLAEGPIDPNRPGGDELYLFFRQAVDWCARLPEGHTFKLRCRDAICDELRSRRGYKPSPPESGTIPDLPLYTTAYKDHVCLYADMSGDSLHRRGYRAAMHRASLNEAAAAGILSLAGWSFEAAQSGRCRLVDPMCGSGTLLIEAALIATNTPPGIFRQHWPFLRWPDFDLPAWRQALKATRERPVQWRGYVQGNDIYDSALWLAHRDIEAAGMQDYIQLSEGPCDCYRPNPVPTLVVTNPPWGARLTEHGYSERPNRSRSNSAGHNPQQESLAHVRESWHQLKSFFRDQCSGSSAFILSGNPEATKELNMRPSSRTSLSLGGIDCQVLEYKIRPSKAEMFRQQAEAMR